MKKWLIIFWAELHNIFLAVKMFRMVIRACEGDLIVVENYPDRDWFVQGLPESNG
jgi:hypothetical protein